MPTRSHDIYVPSSANAGISGFQTPAWVSAGNAILSSLPHLACIMHANGDVLIANQAWRDVFPPHGKVWKDALHPSDQASLAAVCERRDGPEYPEIEARLNISGHGWQWHRISLRQMQDVFAGETNLFLMTVWSIDDYRQSVDEREAELTLQSKMLDSSADCIKILSPSGHLRKMNRAGCTALGVDPDGGFGMSWLSLLPAQVRRTGEAALARARSGKDSSFPGMSQLPGHSPAYWNNVLTPILDEDGQVTEIVCISRDVTTETERRQELRIAQQSLQLSAEVARLGRFELRLEDRHLEIDSFCAEHLSVADARKVGFNDELLAVVHPEDRDAVTEAVRAGLDPQGDRNFEFDFRSAEDEAGQSRYLHVKGVALFENERPWRAIGTVQDVTQDRLIRRELQEARDQLEASLESEKILATEMHHRIKNLFTVMAGLVSMSRRQIVQNDEAAYVLDSLRQRVLAMARATDMIAKISGRYVSRSSFDPQQISGAVLEPYEGQVEVSGDVAELGAHMLTPVVLLLHELATNSLKHGALLRHDGKVRVEWNETDGEVIFQWKESGGPEILSVPEHSGLGTDMLKSVVRMAGGDIQMGWPREGLHATIRFAAE